MEARGSETCAVLARWAPWQCSVPM